MNNVPTILALDASSTTLGYCLYAGRVLAHGEHKLTGGDIACRCETAYDILTLLLKKWPQVDVVAIESPVWRFPNSTIPQCEVRGVLLLACAQHWKPFCDVSPAAAKFALAGIGQCSKETMQARASAYGVLGEHASDALGVALASLKQIEVVV
jgi:Holliday junction resolvasome RuvABC endonuclease subunit